MDSDTTLRRTYLEFNKKYFHSELPEDTVLMWAPSPGASAQTDSVDCQDGQPLQFVISVDPALGKFVKITKLLLLHEMIHIKLWNRRRLNAHGSVFDEEWQHLLSYKSIRKLL